MFQLSVTYRYAVPRFLSDCIVESQFIELFFVPRIFNGTIIGSILVGELFVLEFESLHGFRFFMCRL